MRKVFRTSVKDKRGFTLIEIIVAMAIVAALSVSGALSYTTVLKRGRDSKRISDVEQIRSALEMYRATNGAYPSSASWTELSDSNNLGLVSGGFIASIPKDPRRGSTLTSVYSYQYQSTNACGALWCGYCLGSFLEAHTPNPDSTCSIGLYGTGGKTQNYGRRHP